MRPFTRVALCAIVLGAVSSADARQAGRAMDLNAMTKNVTVNGLSFPVIDQGTGPAVLLLHGFPDSRLLWRNQIGPLLDAGFRVIAPDLRGFGEPRERPGSRYRSLRINVVPPPRRRSRPGPSADRR